MIVWMRIDGLVGVAAFSILAMSCAVAPEPGERTVLVLDGDWLARDASEAVAACDEWRRFSENRLACEIANGGSGGDATLRRQDLPRGDYYHLFLSDRSIAIDINQARADGWSDKEIRTLIEHAIGRAVGIKKHGAAGVMSTDNMVHGFTDEDRVVCRAAGFCP